MYLICHLSVLNGYVHRMSKSNRFDPRCHVAIEVRWLEVIIDMAERKLVNIVVCCPLFLFTCSYVLQTLMGKVSLTIARLKSGLIPNQRTNFGVGMKKSESSAIDCKSASRHVAKSKFYYFSVVVALHCTLLVVVVTGSLVL